MYQVNNNNNGDSYTGQFLFYLTTEIHVSVKQFFQPEGQDVGAVKEN